MAETRKIIQIEMSLPPNETPQTTRGRVTRHQHETLLALCDDGTLWVLENPYRRISEAEYGEDPERDFPDWEIMPNVPQGEEYYG